MMAALGGLNHISKLIEGLPGVNGLNLTGFYLSVGRPS